MFDLLLVTDRGAVGDRDFGLVVDEALRGGVDAVQLREKDLAARDLLALARDLREVTRRHGAQLLINDRIDVALAVEADGVHLPSSSFAIADARRILGDSQGDSKIVGVSTHSRDEASAAASGGADYVVFGPIFDTPSKRAYGAAQGLEALRAVVASVSVPVIAIGGIDATNIATVRATGVHGIAAIRSLLTASDPSRIAARLRQPQGA